MRMAADLFLHLEICSHWRASPTASSCSRQHLLQVPSTLPRCTLHSAFGVHSLTSFQISLAWLSLLPISGPPNSLGASRCVHQTSAASTHFNQAPLHAPVSLIGLFLELRANEHRARVGWLAVSGSELMRNAIQLWDRFVPNGTMRARTRRHCC